MFYDYYSCTYDINGKNSAMFVEEETTQKMNTIKRIGSVLKIINRQMRGFKKCSHKCITPHILRLTVHMQLRS